MKRHRLLAVSVIGTAGLVMFGCGGKTVVHERPVIVKESAQPIIIQSETMPPPRDEQPGPPPRAEDVWVAGHWEQRG